MKHVLIVFVPTDASQRDFEAALRECFASLGLRETPSKMRAGRGRITDNDQLPFWTWFVPTSCR